jgi:hypothetical protein
MFSLSALILNVRPLDRKNASAAGRQRTMKVIYSQWFASGALTTVKTKTWNTFGWQRLSEIRRLAINMKTRINAYPLSGLVTSFWNTG